MNKKHIGSNFDDWLKEIGEGYLINISACKHFKGLGECEIMEGLCIKNECYYKECERLKAQNEKLKNNWRLDCLKCEYKNTKADVDKYKQALEEVREIINSYCHNMCNGCYSECINHEIKQKINEVFKDERN